MKPVSLRIKAFGPYLEEQYIDFSKFSESNLFLIHGETGSGKTAILDAVTYALYGKSSGGSRGDIGQMRCDRAGANEETIVEYEFTVRDVRYKFIRNIKCTRNNNLTVTQNALIRRNEIYEQLAENDNQTTVNAEAERIIGLSYEQFRQVIILPQGQFENFLTSKSDVKEKILNTLFNAEKWSEIARILWEKSKKFEHEIKEEESDIVKILKSFECENSAELKLKIELIENSLKIIDGNLKILNERHSTLHKEIQSAAIIAEKFKTLAEYEKQFTELTRNAAETDELRGKLTISRNAMNVRYFYDMYVNIENKINERNAEIEQLSDEIFRAKTQMIEYSDRLQDIEVARDEYERNRKLYERYLSAAELYSEYEKRYDEAVNFSRKRYELQNKSDKTETKLNAHIERITQLKDKHYFISIQYKPVITELRNEVRILEELKTTKEKLGLCKERLTDKDTVFQLNTENFNKLNSEYKIKYEKYLLNTAAVLADTLKDGEPCPVCGSVHHPESAKYADGEVTADDINMLSERVEKSKSSIDTVRNEITKLTLEADNLNDVLNKLESEYSYTPNKLREARVKLKQAEDECDKLDVIQKQIELAEADKILLENEFKALENELNELDKQRENALADCRAMKLRMDDEIKSSSELKQRTAKLNESITQYETKRNEISDLLEKSEKIRSELEIKARASLSESEKLSSERDDIKIKYDNALNDNKFLSQEDFLRVINSEFDIETLNEKINDYDIKYANYKSNIGSLKNILKDEKFPDLESLNNEFNDVSENIKEYSKNQAVYKGVLGNYHSAYNMLTHKERELEERRRIFGKLSNFAVSVYGIRGVGLSRYILGIMLSAVINEANMLLKNVHGGRYSLRCTLDSYGRAQKSGLEIEVFDSYTEKIRWASTLSGGEKFLVALALSLGLSGVVQAQSGGIRIDAIFIDEGFGTLDPASVDDALNLLRDINISRSMVGIISHVSFLRENIESSIEVVKKRDGSTLKVSV